MQKFYLIIALLIAFLKTSSQTYEISLIQAKSQQTGKVLELSNENVIINDLVITGGFYYNKLILLNQFGDVLLEKRYENCLISDIIEISEDSLLFIAHEYVDSTHNNLVTLLLDFNLQEINRDSYSISHKMFYKAKFSMWKNNIYFFSSYFVQLGLHETAIVMGKLNRNGTFQNDIKSNIIQGLGAEELIINANEQFFLIQSLGLILRFNSKFEFIDVSGLGQKDLVKDFDSFYNIDNDRYFISGSFLSAKDLNKFMIIETNNELQEISNIQISTNYPTVYAGHYSNLARAENGFFFTGTINADISPKIYVAKISYDFEIEWEKEIGENDNFNVYSITSTKNGGCIIVSSKDDNTDTTAFTDLYVIKMTAQGDYNSAIIPRNIDLLIYPNPGNEFLNILFNNSIKNTTFNLYSISGQKVFSKTIKSSHSIVNTTALSQGLYIWEFTKDGTFMKRGKWIKQ